MPVPISIACEAPCERGSVIRELKRFSLSAIVLPLGAGQRYYLQS
jgi:hypothetical protein